MQEPVKKKTKRKIPALWLILLLLIPATVITVWLLQVNSPSEDNEVLYREMTDGNVFTRETAEVESITVTPAKGEPWTVMQTSEGVLTLEGVSNWNVDPVISELLLDAAATVHYESILSENRDEYAGNLSEFGLDEPLVTAAFDYTDGSRYTIRIGMQSILDDETFFYMTADGDDRLFAMDCGTAQIFLTEQELLHPVSQPGINPNRIDRITVEDTGGQIRAGWSLNGTVTDGEQGEEWNVDVPVTYPADQDSMNELLQNTGNLYLGIYVGEATPENLKECGLEKPEAALELHMAPGSVGEVTEDGAYIVTEQPEQTIRFDIGASKNDLVRYILYNDTIYTMNSFQLDVFLNAVANETVSRYPFVTAFEHLAGVTVEKDGETHEYILTHTWTTDEEGNSVHDGECLKDGEMIGYDVFEAAYERLRVVTVSGRLGENETEGREPYIKYTFRTLNGGTHTVSFYDTDFYHDAVECDGYRLFYILRGSLTDLP